MAIPECVEALQLHINAHCGQGVQESELGTITQAISEVGKFAGYMDIYLPTAWQQQTMFARSSTYSLQVAVPIFNPQVPNYEDTATTLDLVVTETVGPLPLLSTAWMVDPFSPHPGQSRCLKVFSTDGNLRVGHNWSLHKVGNNRSGLVLL